MCQKEFKGNFVALICSKISNPNVASGNGNESGLVFIVAHEVFDILNLEVRDNLSRLGLRIEEMWENNGKLRTANFYLDHLRGEREDPAKIRILIAGIGVPILQLASKLPHLDAAFTTDPDYRSIVAIGGPMLTRAYYIPAPNGNPDSRTYASQMTLSRLVNVGYFPSKICGNRAAKWN